jgi:hypothetical protein
LVPGTTVCGSVIPKYPLTPKVNNPRTNKNFVTLLEGHRVVTKSAIIAKSVLLALKSLLVMKLDVLLIIQYFSAVCPEFQLNPRIHKSQNSNSGANKF